MSTNQSYEVYEKAWVSQAAMRQAYNVLELCPWRSLYDNQGKMIGIELDVSSIAVMHTTLVPFLRGLSLVGFEGCRETTPVKGPGASDDNIQPSFAFDSKAIEYRSKTNAEPMHDYTFSTVSGLKHPAHFILRGEKNIGLVLNLLNPANEVNGQQELKATVTGRSV